MARGVPRLCCLLSSLLSWHYIQASYDHINYQGDLIEGYQFALSRLLNKSSTEECQKKIHDAFSQYWKAILFEESFPFERQEYFSQCPQRGSSSSLRGFRYNDEPAPKKPTPVNITRQPEKPIDSSSLGILYLVLVHQSPEFAFRLIDALNESQHTFVLHVDLKSVETEEMIARKIATMNSPNIFLVPHDLRSAISWGGYSIVNATLATLEFGVSLGRKFDFVINLSGSTYPIQTNSYIRKYLSRNPNAIYNSIKPRESKPPPETWHYFVECDNALHRIGRLPPPRGISMHVGSQWFAFPKHVAEWLLTDPLPLSYQAYATHVVVADEHYFSTMLSHSPFCRDLINLDVNFLQFAQWEVGNPLKCLQPDPKRCGRSPANLSPLFFPAVMMSDAFFARKFNPQDEESLMVLSKLDSIRGQREQEEKTMRGADGSATGPLLLMSITDEFSNHPDQLPLDGKYQCLQMPKKTGDDILVTPCDTTNKLQYFTQEKCISINANLYNSSKYRLCPSEFHPFSPPAAAATRYPQVVDTSLVHDDHPDPQIYCRYRSLASDYAVPAPTPATASDNGTNSGEKNENSKIPICLDVKGQLLTETSIISYQCAGSWNQYFRWTEDGRLSATLPFIMAKTRGINATDLSNSTICLHVAANTKPNSPDIVKTSPCECSTGKPMPSRQIFRIFSPRDLPRDMTLKQGEFVKKNLTQRSAPASVTKFNASTVSAKRGVAPVPVPESVGRAGEILDNKDNKDRPHPTEKLGRGKRQPEVQVQRNEL